jgi:sortase A
MSDTTHTKNDLDSDAQHATDLIRQKIEGLYASEPSAEEEVAESFDPTVKSHSKHQRFMQDLTKSGKSLADIQTAWHQYYAALPDNEKHAVWQEFYDQHGKQDVSQYATQSTIEIPKSHNTKQMQPGKRSVSELKKQLLAAPRTKSRGSLKAKQHFQSLLFGLAMGSIVVLIMLFGLFNDRFIAPFISPSKQVSNTPIIIDSATTAVGSVPKIIIPKINVEIPVIYDEPSLQEGAIQKALERGVVHYANTPNPGELGNAVIFGHSSNNILNKGQYKFAFVLLNKLEIGDVFFLTKDGVRYSYKIYDKKIVKPTDLGVLNATSKPATATLITCDPPGTSLNRLVVVGEQINPDPKNNKPSTVAQSNEQLTVIPSNSPSLWQRFVNWVKGL